MGTAAATTGSPEPNEWTTELVAGRVAAEIAFLGARSRRAGPIGVGCPRGSPKTGEELSSSQTAANGRRAETSSESGRAAAKPGAESLVAGLDVARIERTGEVEAKSTAMQDRKPSFSPSLNPLERLNLRGFVFMES